MPAPVEGADVAAFGQPRWHRARLCSAAFSRAMQPQRARTEPDIASRPASVIPKSRKRIDPGRDSGFRPCARRGPIEEKEVMAIELLTVPHVCERCATGQDSG